MFDIFKSKKIQLLIVGFILAVLVGYAMLWLEMPEALIVKAVAYVLGLVGVVVTAHTATDITSMVKGLQKKIEKG